MGTGRSREVGTLGWFMLGGLIGTAMGILLAPRRGSETRHQLTEKARHVGRRAQDLAAGAQDRAGDWLNRGRAGDWLDTGREVIEEQAQRLATVVESRRESTPGKPDGPAETPRG